LNIDKRENAVIVAVIDSGIDISKCDLYKYVKISKGFRINDEGYIIEDNDMEVRHEHGTAIALTIKHLCSNVEFISVNILNENLTTDGRVLIYALKNVLKYKPDIIHLSLGTTKWKYKFSLKKIVRASRKSNILIVSAANNQGFKSYPAYLDGVIGVKAISSESQCDFIYHNNFLYAPPTIKNISGIEELKDSYMEGTSISAAYITGYIANIKNHKDFKKNEDLISYIKSKTTDIRKEKTYD
jgi:subtilisin family serine protease